MILNLVAVFQCPKKPNLKLSKVKFYFGVQKVDFFGRAITTKGIAPLRQKVAKFLKKIMFPRSKKHFKDTLDFWITIETICLD